jgi:predicted small lipoprotein YifL
MKSSITVVAAAALVAGVTLALTLDACGQKGPLVKPGPRTSTPAPAGAQPSAASSLPAPAESAPIPKVY